MTKVADGAIRAEQSPEIECPDCGARVPLHLRHWVAEVCPKCLRTFRWGNGADYSLYTDSGWFDGATQPKIRANIARNGGRYIPA